MQCMKIFMIWTWHKCLSLSAHIHASHQVKHASNAAVPQKLNQEMSSNFDGNHVRVKMSNFPRKFDRILSNFCRKLVKMKNVMNLAKNWSVKQAIAADVPESIKFFPSWAQSRQSSKGHPAFPTSWMGAKFDVAILRDLCMRLYCLAGKRLATSRSGAAKTRWIGIVIPTHDHMKSFSVWCHLKFLNWREINKWHLGRFLLGGLICSVWGWWVTGWTAGWWFGLQRNIRFWQNENMIGIPKREKEPLVVDSLFFKRF